MKYVVFYSWLGDHPNSTNRSFIEKALKSALEKVANNASLEEANREIELDKDTKNVPGMPPISDVIFDKISACSIFVADLSFIGTIKDNRPIQNPNVLIEYGWALKAVGYSRIIGVMNTSHGSPDRDKLPFDMRHLRHPLLYDLRDNSTANEKAKAKEELQKKLESAILLVIKHLDKNKDQINSEKQDTDATNKNNFDKAIYAKERKIIDQDMTDFIYETIGSDHSYNSKLMKHLDDFCRFSKKPANTYFNELVNDARNAFADSVNKLALFLATHFFVYPNKQNSDNPRLALYPELNVDRGGRGTPEESVMYTTYTKKLISILETFKDSFSSYRNAIKNAYFI